MPLTKSYATKDQYQKEISDTSTDESESILLTLAAVSRLLDIEAGQCFGKDDAVTTHVFRGDGTNTLRLAVNGLPGIATLTGVVIKVDTDGDGSFADETALDNATLLFLGRGGDFDPDKGSEAAPWTMVELTSRSAIGAFPRGALVQVVAVFGWPSTPKIVTSLTILTTAIREGKHPLFTGVANDLDGVASISPMTGNVVRRFRNAYALAVVA